MKKLRFRIIAMILIMALAAGLSSECFAQDGTAQTVYVAEIKTFSSREECEKAGYIFSGSNLNEGGNACYLGYKTTTDPDKAVTDLKMLQMGLGYQTDYNYGELMEEKLNLGATSANLHTAAVYFTDHYKESPLGMAAYNVLNYYYVPAEYNASGKDIPFGDFVASDDCTEEFIESYLVRINAAGTNLLINQLAAGVADSSSENTWADRVKKSVTVSLLAAKQPTSSKLKKYDGLYRYATGELFKQLTEFAATACRAIEHKNTYGGFDNTGAAVAEKKGEQASEAYADKALTEGMQAEDSYELYYNLYLKLNEYSVKSDLLLGDYILTFSTLDSTNVKNLRKMYPLVEAMTREQIIMTKYAGLAAMIGFLDNTPEKGKTCAEKTAEKMNELFEFIIEEQLAKDERYKGKSDAEKKILREELKKNKRLSIYDNIISDIYKDKVCVTNDLIKLNIASGSLQEFLDDSQSKALERERKQLIANIVLSSVCLADLCISLLMVTTSLAATAFGAVYASLAIPILIGTTAAMFLIELANSARALEDWETVENTEDEVPWVDIPASIYSVEKPTEVVNGVKTEKTRIILYNCVQNGVSGAMQDLNAGDGNRWNALYYSTESEAGSPLVVEDGLPAFRVQSNFNDTPNNYVPLTIMGSSANGNMNSYSKKTDRKPLYLFYCTEDSVNATEQTNQGTKVNTTTYLSDLMLAYSNNEATAKAKIIDRGYTLVETNLTPNMYYYLDVNNTKVFTYIGYKTTTDKKAAITDIRVANSFADQQISYGSATYVNAGTTVGGDSLIYATSETAGTPITGNIYVYDSTANAPEGYEPVNLLSGGPAFNFSRSATTANYYQSSFTIEGQGNRYIYFRPTTMYTSKSGNQQYISGLFALRGCWKNGDFGSDKLNHFRLYLEDYSITVLTTLPDDFTCYFSDYDHPIIRIDGYETYGALAYTTTYNPYRAIYDIKVYQGSNTAPSLLPTLANANGVYAACESYGMGRVHYSTGWWQDLAEDLKLKEIDFQNKVRTTILPFHSISKTVGPNLNKEENYNYTYFDLVRAELCENNTGADYVTNCLKGLYVLGNTQSDIGNAHPIRVDQLVVSRNRDMDNKSGYQPVVNFMTPNATAAMAINNIVSKDFRNGSYQQEDWSEMGWHYETRKDCSHLNEEGPYYLYIKLNAGDKLNINTGIREKYISAITVGGSSFTDDNRKGYNDDIARAGALAGSSDEIIYNNIAVKNSECWYFNSNKKSLYITFRESESYKYTFEGKTCTGMNYVDRAAYIGLSRTDDINSAIYNIIKVRISNTENFPSTLKIGNVTYQSSGGVVYDTNGAYVLYYTRNPGAGDGTPITDISIDTLPMVNGKLGVCCYTLESDGKSTEYSDTTAGSEKYILMTSEGCTGESSQQMAYISLGIGAGTTQIEAMSELLSKGYQNYINADLNYKARAGHILMGYIRVPYTQLVADGEEDIAITDVIFRVGKTYTKTIEVNGITYEGEPTSLNSCTNGKTVYMYVTRDPAVTTKSLFGKGTTGSNAITGICFYVGNYRPDVSVKQWEAALDEYGNMANLNEGVWHSKYGDCRLYMYVSRIGNCLKPESEKYLSKTFCGAQYYYTLYAKYTG